VSLDRVRIVLVRPKSFGNVGAAARAMKNLGLKDLRLVAPRRGREAAAVVRSVHAADVLAAAQRHASLADAITDCAWVVGTTCRPGSYRRRTLTPREAAPEILSVCGANRAALVFGPEDHGLSNEAWHRAYTELLVNWFNQFVFSKKATEATGAEKKPSSTAPETAFTEGQARPEA